MNMAIKINSLNTINKKAFLKYYINNVLGLMLIK